jgi:transposase
VQFGSRRFLCQTLLLFLFARRFFQHWQQGSKAKEIARRFGLSLRTVQRLLARFEQRGADGIGPDYDHCGQDQAQQTAPQLVEHVCQTRRDHQRWGTEMIRLELEQRYDTLPSTRTMRRHLRKAGLGPAPAGRMAAAEYPLVPRAERPHQGWQTDASEELRLQSNQQVCWLRFVDECSGAFLKTLVFPAARWEHVDRHTIQEGLRQVFSTWGLPERLRVDNGYPWGSGGEFPPEMALWLIGLGIEMVWIPPACPQQNGVVERAQGTGQRWTEPGTCTAREELQRRCDELDRLQRERYPYRDQCSRWQVYPSLKHTGRTYRRREEASAWDVSKVWAVIGQQVVQRRVDASGSVSLYHRTRYVGKPYIGKIVYVSLDPTGPTWVIADQAGNELRTHAAEELTAERVRGLSVMCRKGKQS